MRWCSRTTTETIPRVSRPWGPGPACRSFTPRDSTRRSIAALRGSGARLVPVSKSVEILPGFHTSDEFGNTIKEEALLVDTPDGLVVIVGCSHPGIVPMLRQIKASTGRPIHAVLGGFHLMQTPADEVKRMVAEFQELGVGRVGPTHCTGPDAIARFKEAYGDRFIQGGVGTVVTARR